MRFLIMLVRIIERAIQMRSKITLVLRLKVNPNNSDSLLTENYSRFYCKAKE